MGAIVVESAILRQTVLNAGMRASDPQWEDAIDLAGQGWPSWKIAQAFGADRHVVLALGAPAQGVET
jgi:hypothetical protein